MRKNIVYERLDVYNDTDSFLTWRASVFLFIDGRLAMPGIERRQRVMEMLTHDGKVYVSKLAEVFRVTEDHPPRPRKDMIRAGITSEMRGSFSV